ncbi:MAG: hypothetical protein HXY23_13980 [Parvularculaceae bacterium]|nr:hypothetical protein [Parvularculaceae bacterium]
MHFEKLIGLAGFSFGVWRWWHHRERVLHKRLQEYLAEQDRRLHRARSYVLEAIFRPGRKRQVFADPLFSVRPLRLLLRRRGWDSLLGLGKVESVADRMLNKSLGRIERRLETAFATLAALRKQRASAHILKGAIASARAQSERDPIRRGELDDCALVQFRTALQVLEHGQDVQAKEYEAHQLRKLGHLDDAEAAYAELEEFAASLSDQRDRDLMLARARRCRAEIAQAQAISAYRRQLRNSQASGRANQLMTSPDGALALRAPHGPFREWEAVEQGEMHYLSAFIYRQLEAIVQEPVQLGLAGTAYKRVLMQTPSSRWLIGGATRRLRAAAEAGLQRVKRAQERSEYDLECLLPPLDHPQQPPESVGQRSGDQGVSKAT